MSSRKYLREELGEGLLLRLVERVGEEDDEGDDEVAKVRRVAKLGHTLSLNTTL